MLTSVSIIPYMPKHFSKNRNGGIRNAKHCLVGKKGKKNRNGLADWFLFPIFRNMNPPALKPQKWLASYATLQPASYACVLQFGLEYNGKKFYHRSYPLIRILSSSVSTCPVPFSANPYFFSRTPSRALLMPSHFPAPAFFWVMPIMSPLRARCLPSLRFPYARHACLSSSFFFLL